jgi:hypothetical protein
MRSIRKPIDSPAITALLWSRLLMPEAAQISSSFPTARCSACDRYVLTYFDFDGVTAARRSEHCDGTVDADLRWINASEL